MEITELYKIAGIIGCGVFSYVGYIWKRKRERLMANGIPVEGVVFELKPDNDHEKPVIRFVTLKKEWITKEYRVGYSKGLIKEGQKVNVYYDADDPGEFVLDVKIDKWVPLVFIVAGLLGVVLLFLSLFTDIF